MTGNSKAIVWIAGGVAVLAAIWLGGGGPAAAQPSFDCRKASTPNEITICAHPELGELDRLIAGAYGKVKARLGTETTNRIHLPYLRARRDCGANPFCIMQRQASEIPVFEALGVNVRTPAWLDAEPPTYSRLKQMVTVGECTASTITDIGYRLCSPDGNNVCMPAEGSGTTVTLANGLSQVSYDSEPEVFKSGYGDPVIACLVEKPTDCPPGDDRGYTWSVTNLRTGGVWTMPDSQHMCGGA